jgi:hypothetical protein
MDALADNHIVVERMIRSETHYRAVRPDRKGGDG